MIMSASHSCRKTTVAKTLLILLIPIFIIGCSSEKVEEKPRIFEKDGSRKLPQFLIVDLGPLNPNIFNALLDENRLPNIRKLMEDGGSLAIQSPSNGFLNDAAVTSEILTGQPAGFNGIATGCWGADNSLGFVSAGWKELTSPSLSQKLSDHKINSLFINWPLTHAPAKLRAVIISDHFLLCPEDCIYPPELREFLMDNSILPKEENIKSNIKGLLDPKSAFEKSDIEALNRFLNFPLSEGNFESLIKDNVDPGPDNLERCLRLLSWELRKDRLTLSIISLLKNNYYLPEFMAFRSGTLEVAQSYFMRFHYARGFNITPTEMERFGAAVERCYEYEDELVGKILELADSNRDVILVSGFQLEPAFFGKDSLGLDSTKMMVSFRGHPVSLRANPADLAHSLNKTIQPKMDVIFHPPMVWPMNAYWETIKTYEYTILPYSIDPNKIGRVINFLATCSDSQGNPLFSQVYISDTSGQKVAVSLKPDIKPGEVYNASGNSIFTDDFINAFPQVCVFPRPGGMVIMDFARWLNPDSTRLNRLTDLHDLILKEMGIEEEKTTVDSMKTQITNPEENTCDRALGYRFRALGYLK